MSSHLKPTKTLVWFPKIIHVDMSIWNNVIYLSGTEHHIQSLCFFLWIQFKQGSFRRLFEYKHSRVSVLALDQNNVFCVLINLFQILIKKKGVINGEMYQ